MNVEFNKNKDIDKLELLATGRCFILHSKKTVRGERIIFMKTDYVPDDAELDPEKETPLEYLCTRLTGDRSGAVIKFSRSCLVVQIDFKLVEEK